MNKRIVLLLLASMAVIFGIVACAVGPVLAPTSNSTPGSTSTPTSNPSPLSNSSPIPPTFTSAPTLAPTDTPTLDLATILANNGFERNKGLDTACGTSCSAYTNSTVNVIADFYYTNKSFSLLYYAKDPNGANEQAEAAVVTKLLTELYSGTLSNDVMMIANDFPKNLGKNNGVAGNYLWTVSIKVTYNLDRTIKQATIYIGIAPG
jgi:hypothetical protein